LIGPTNSSTAKIESPNSIRALFGTDGTKNAVHGSDSQGSVKRETEFWFASTKNMKTTA
jgi:nucleoside-diphosphate kinase